MSDAAVAARLWRLTIYQPTGLVQRAWNDCNPALAGRDDCLSHGDSVDPLSFLRFLKLSDEPRPSCVGRWFPSPLPANLLDVTGP
jgi:hypothetical protein